MAEEKDDSKEECGKSSSDASAKPNRVWQPAKGKQDQALVEFMKSETFEIFFHAQMTIGYITSNIRELEREFLLTRHPHRVPKGLAGNAARSLQKLLDMVNMLHLTKIESHPFEKWPLSPAHLSYVDNFFEKFAQTLHVLGRAVLKPGTNIDGVIAHIEATEKIAEEHMHYNMNARVQNKETGAEKINPLKSDDSLASKEDVLSYIEDPITFLNYLEVCCCRQLRSLIISVLHAVLITKTHKVVFEEHVSPKLKTAQDDTTEYQSRCGLEAEYFMAEFEDILEEQKNGDT